MKSKRDPDTKAHAGSLRARSDDRQKR
jgi:hypothetical protein